MSSKSHHPRPARYDKTPVLSGADRHLVSRFSYGLTPALVAEVNAAGGGAAWFEQQIATAYADPAGDAAAVDHWPDLHLDAGAIWQRQVAKTRGSWEVMWDYGRQLMLRRITSPRQLLEVMTEFWESHLHVAANGDAQAMWRVPYGDVIRRHALGRFDEMLTEAITHPAMLIFLDAATSTKAHPNENLGRELLELHTVGLGNYSEDDVKNASRILTGYKVDLWKTWKASYSAADHWTGPVQVAEFSAPNADADGRQVVADLLAYLARRPETARRLARKLVTKFVTDSPEDALVEQLAQTYLANDTAIVPVLRQLVGSPAFRRSRGEKLRDPGEDVVATYRALGADLHKPSDDDDAANVTIWQAQTVGLMPMAWPRPDGQPLDNQPWSGPDRAISSMQVHWVLAGGWWPKTGVDYRSGTDWAPELPIRFDALIDHMARVMHGQPASANLLKAVCTAVATPRRTTITADHPVLTWKLNRLVGCFLDHPRHFER